MAIHSTAVFAFPIWSSINTLWKNLHTLLIIGSRFPGIDCPFSKAWSNCLNPFTDFYTLPCVSRSKQSRELILFPADTTAWSLLGEEAHLPSRLAVRIDFYDFICESSMVCIAYEKARWQHIKLNLFKSRPERKCRSFQCRTSTVLEFNFGKI